MVNNLTVQSNLVSLQGMQWCLMTVQNFGRPNGRGAYLSLHLLLLIDLLLLLPRLDWGQEVAARWPILHGSSHLDELREDRAVVTSACALHENLANPDSVVGNLFIEPFGARIARSFALLSSLAFLFVDNCNFLLRSRSLLWVLRLIDTWISQLWKLQGVFSALALPIDIW